MLLTSSIVLTSDELRLVHAAQAAEAAVFSAAAGEPALIRAEVIRALLLGIPVAFKEGAQAVRISLTGVGIQIENARIEGQLDLEGCCEADGGALAPLLLLSCIVPEPIRLRRARLRHLSLRGSRITHLDGADITIEGPLDLSRLASAEDALDLARSGADGKGLCWIDLTRAHIAGELTAAESVLVAPPCRPEYTRFSMTPRYAFDLSNAVVGGNLALRPFVYALGGVSVRDTEIHGPLYADGCTFLAVEDFAFDGSYADIRGHLGLRLYMRREKDSVVFRAAGGVRLHGTRIAGDLQITGAEITAGHADSGIDAQDIRINGNCFLRSWLGSKRGRNRIFRLVVKGGVSMMNARVQGCLDMSGTVLTAKRPGSPALDATNAEVGNYCAFTCRMANISGHDRAFRFVARGGLNLTAMKIVGNLNANGARIVAGAGELAIDGKEAEIGKNCTLSSVDGTAVLAKGEVRLTNSSAAAPFAEEDPEDVASEEATGSAQSRMAFVARGGISLVGAHVAGNLELIDARLECSDGLYALNAQNAEITGDCVLGPVHGPAPKLPRLLLLSGARIGRVFRLGFHKAPLPRRARIDVRDLHAGVLDDANGAGWGGGHLFLNGFRYDYLNEHLNSGKNSWKQRIHWLSLQYKGAAPTAREYRPDPYEHLTRVYRSCGLHNDARKITSRKLTIERSLAAPMLFRPFLWLYWGCFDYGLSPVRGLSTFLLCLGLGWGMFSIADTGMRIAKFGISVPAVMVVNSTAVNSVLRVGSDGLEPGTPVDAHARGEELPCRDQMDSKLYAAEVFIPGISLHQQSNCRISNRTDGWGAFWRIAKAVYSGLGWIVTSLTVLTVSGILRRHVEG